MLFYDYDYLITFVMRRRGVCGLTSHAPAEPNQKDTIWDCKISDPHNSNRLGLQTSGAWGTGGPAWCHIATASC